MLTSKLKKVYHADYDYYTYYTILIGIAQLNTFSCAKKQKQQNNIYLWCARPVPPETNVTKIC